MVDSIYDNPYVTRMSLEAESFYAALAHPLRLRALLLLQQEGELCVCELTHALGVSQPMISRHLAQLRQSGVVGDRRQGLWVYYRLHEALPAWASQVLAATADGVADQSPYDDDRQALAGMVDRPGNACCA
ncbi:metalloregulator ArsR/SmtB family transcription factor [Thiohalophilus sp.]|uniref:metalloregulator ArsR/SmtB family transcription factor n=1 Tax=Thiohalophilus sp. TaxID=3028392 RepID=UPI0039755823